MAAEYDLIVIGASSAGIYGAAMAASLNARVALVDMDTYGSFEGVYNRTLETANRLTVTSPSIWANAVVENLTAYSPVRLASLGVDIIHGVGEFYRLPHLGFAVGKRRLSSSHYLLALPHLCKNLVVDGLEDIGYLTLQQIWQQDKLSILPKRLLIVGSSLQSIELAQNLQRLGKEVTLATKHHPLLPWEDADIAFLLQAQLESEGIRILTHSEVTQVKKIEKQTWVQVGNQAVETDEIIWAELGQPNLSNLNLAGIGLEATNGRLDINKRLQTSNSRIYGCGAVVGGYNLPHVAEYEAEVAVKNALFLPTRQVDYASIPWVLFTQPQVARVGMSASQARSRYGDKVIVISHSYKHLAQAQLTSSTTGLCKLVAHPHGRILGAHLVGKDAGELIGEMAIAIKHRLKLKDIVAIHHPFPTLSAIFTQTAQSWQEQEFGKGKKNRVRWLRWRRGWF